MDGVVYCLVPEATAYDAKTGKVLWCEPSLIHPMNRGGISPVVCGDVLFCRTTMYDLTKNGEKIGELKFMDGPRLQWPDECASPILVDGKIIATCGAWGATGRGLLHMWKATREGQPLGRMPPTRDDVALFTSPAYAGGMLYVRSYDCVVCYDLRAK